MTAVTPQDIQAEGLEKVLILLDLYRDLAARCRRVAAVQDERMATLLYALGDLYDAAITLTTERIDAGDSMSDVSVAVLTFETLRNPFSVDLC